MGRLTDRDRIIYGRLWAEPPNFKPSDTAVEMIAALPASARVADVACGGGRHTLYAAEQGCEVVAIDHNPTAVDGLRERTAGLPVTVSQDDLVAWVEGQSPAAFDAVICFDAIHHISPSRDVVLDCLQQLAKLSRPGGYLLVSFLSDIAFGNGEQPPGRLNLASAEADELLDAATAGLVTLKRKQRTIERDVQSIDPATGMVGSTTYRATRSLRLCKVPE